MTLQRDQWREVVTGRDPYDALRSRRIPALLTRNARMRQLVVQVRRRCPVELGPVLGIEPFIMAKSVACRMMAVARNEPSVRRDDDLRALVDLLYEAEGCLGDGRWGYEFDVQTRWAFYPKGSPNLIVSAFVARGLAEAGAVLGDPRLLDAAADAGRWIAENLVDRSEPPFTRYVPDSSRLVHNANLLGAGCIALAGAVLSDTRMTELATRLCVASLRAQRDDGGWPYGDGHGLEWEDSFHTAYVLDGLLTVWLATGDSAALNALERGSGHWSDSFFGSRGEPWYGPGRRYPYDIHSAATALDVGSRLARHGLFAPELVERIAGWTQEHLVDAKTSHTFARQGRISRDRRHFVRWGDAHYAMGSSSYDLLVRGGDLPFETLLTGRSGASDDGGPDE